jgi:hypothetical protein
MKTDMLLLIVRLFKFVHIDFRRHHLYQSRITLGLWLLYSGSAKITRFNEASRSCSGYRSGSFRGYGSFRLQFWPLSTEPVSSVADPDDFRPDPDPTFKNVRIRILTYINFFPKIFLMKICSKKYVHDPKS